MDVKQQCNNSKINCHEKTGFVGHVRPAKKNSACAPAQSYQSRSMYAPMLRAYILTTRFLSVWPIIVDVMSFAPHSTYLSTTKRWQSSIEWLHAANVNYTTGGIGKGKCLPRSLVAVGGSGVRGLIYLGQRI